MMQHHVTVILAGAAAHFVTGWVINSDMLLGKLWKQEKDKKAAGNLSKDMRLNLVAQAAASIAIAVAACIAICIFEKSQMTVSAKTALEKISNLFFNETHATKNMMHAMRVMLFVWAGFLLPVSAEEVIWCGKSIKHWALESMSQLICLMALAATVTYLS